MIDNSLDKIESDAKKLQQTRTQVYLAFQEQSNKAEQLIVLLLQLSKEQKDKNQSLLHQITKLNNEVQKKGEEMQIKLKQSQTLLANLLNENTNHKAQINKLKQNEDKQLVELSRLSKEYEELERVKQAMERAMTDKINGYEFELAEQRKINDQNVEKMIGKYEQVIEQKVKLIQNKYEEQLNEVKRKTKQKVEQLEAKERLKENNKKQEIKKFSGDSERLLTENKRILSQLTQTKRKNLSLEAELQACRQEVKISKKQKQIVVGNLRKQVELLKSSRNETDSITNWWKEKVDNLNWESKQMQMEKEKQIKMIKEQSERILDQISQKYRQEKQELNQHVDRLEKQARALTNSLELVRRQKDNLENSLRNLEKQVEQKQKRSKNQDDKNQVEQEIGKLKEINSELRKQNVRKAAEIEVLKEQVSRLKSKVNKVTIAYQEHAKLQQIVQKQNKMLLSQIVFLRDKNKSNASRLYSNQKKQSNNKQMGISRKDSRILDLKSEESEIFENNNDELAMYKQLIVEMEKDMNEAVAKLDEKNNIIQKQKGIIERLERALNK